MKTYSFQAIGKYKESDAASALKMRDYKDATDLIVEEMNSQMGESIASVDCRNATENEDVNGTLQSKESGWNTNDNVVCRVNHVVRRLTPKECARLQGFPDKWCEIGEWSYGNGKVHREADSPKYKAYGNTCALPFWQWLDKRISAEYVGVCTLGSLFDGIGAFPLVHARHNGPKSVLWASEIEPFPLAVAKKHFGDEKDGTIGDVMDYLWE